jgi:lipopolysaccharide/colanic/teichoic acid biosynthesis glycosyltransferase
MTIALGQRNKMYKPLKRIIDILIALLALVILSPLLLPVIIILLLTGEHKVFYFQQRVGYRNREFSIYKFATMLQNSPNIGTGEITLRNDPRVTAFGKFLRQSKINELPQIINVLKGDMSIVGPRPLMKKSFELYTDEIKQNIYLSKPGITGIGSIIFRDEEKMVSEADDFRHMYSNVIYPYKGKLELWYLQHASVVTDLKIIFITGWSIIFPENQLAKSFFKNLPPRNF